MSIAKQAAHRTEEEKREAELERQLDEALGMTFPASDPVAIGVERPQPRKEATDGKGPAPCPERA